MESGNADMKMPTVVATEGTTGVKINQVLDTKLDECGEQSALSETTENDDEGMDDEEESETLIHMEVPLVAEDGRPLSDIEVAARYADLEIQSISTRFATTKVELGKPIAVSVSVKKPIKGASQDDGNNAISGDISTTQVDESDDDSSSDEEEAEDHQQLRAEIEAAMEKEEVKASGPLKTANEVELPIREPEVELTLDCPISRCGVVLNVSRPGLMVTVKSDPNMAPLDEGSILCFEDRTVLGCVDEIFGPVMMPMYLIRFENADKIPAQTDLNKVVFFATEHTKYVNPEDIRDKGTDASNLFDEETDETVFSDDEAEAAAKRANKKRNREARAKGTNPQHLTHAIPASFTEYAGHNSYGGGSFRGRGRGRERDGVHRDFHKGGRGGHSGFHPPVQGGFTRYTTGYHPQGSTPHPAYPSDVPYNFPPGPYGGQHYNHHYPQQQYFQHPPLPGHHHIPQYPPQASAPAYYQQPPMPTYPPPHHGGYYPPQRQQQPMGHHFNPPLHHHQQQPPLPPYSSTNKHNRR